MNLNEGVRSILKLSIPIILGQLGQMLISAGDVYVASMYSTKSVAAIGIANGFVNPIFLFGIGLMMGISPALAKGRGEGVDPKDTLLSILMYSILCGICISILTLGLLNFTHLFGVNQELIPSINTYISIVAWSFPFAIAFQGLKEFLQSFESVFFPNLLAILGIFINFGLNFLFVFGMDFIPGMGEVGLAYASFTIRFLMFAVLFIYILFKYKFASFDFTLVKKILIFSLPIGFMFFLEVLAFCTVTVLSGRLGVVEAATNNIIMTIASISFMIPLSISSAIAVKIGHSLGKKDGVGIIKYIYSSLSIIGVYIVLAFSFFFFLPQEIMALTSKDLNVIDLGIKLLFIVALFQLSDCLQVILTGILRGLGETKLSSFLVFIGYWIIGIPTGIYLTFNLEQGAAGLWKGLAISLTLVAIALSVLVFIKVKKIKRDYSVSFEM